MTMQYRGHTSSTRNNASIGTIDDVLYDARRIEPTWAVVDVGLLRASHYVPVAVGYTADDGAFVVPFDKQTVTSAPRPIGRTRSTRRPRPSCGEYYGIHQRARRQLIVAV